MKFLPSDTFEIETNMPLEAIVAAFDEMIEPRRYFCWSSGRGLFQGETSRDGFRITRIIGCQNSFLPIIQGKYLPGVDGVKVAIRMGLHPLAIAFVSVWCGLVGLTGFLSVPTALGWNGGESSGWLIILIPIGMIGFVWALAWGAYWYEASMQKPMLIKMIKGMGARQNALVGRDGARWFGHFWVMRGHQLGWNI
ncbi:MAG: hypothetical protein JKY61_07800 [Planctomycetes bacterium]|nr:hypothetical protein [Planctomycetota bacterium]